MILRTHYSNKEIEVLESYSHRLNNKIHITFPAGAMGDMLWASIFVTIALPDIKDICEICPITPEGRVMHLWGQRNSEIREVTNFTWQKGNNQIRHTPKEHRIEYKSRHDILYAVYRTLDAFQKQVRLTDDGWETDAIDKVDDYDSFCQYDYGDTAFSVIDIMLSHCCVYMTPDIIKMFETEFNQKMIFIVPNESDAELYGKICNRKTDNQFGLAYSLPIRKVNKNITDNALVINPIRFLGTEEIYRKCIKEILDFSDTETNNSTIDKMVSYRTRWFNKQQISSEEYKLLKKNNRYNHYQPYHWWPPRRDGEPTKMTLRTQYNSKEIEVLESYSHRLNNKVHITFPGGTFGDMLWSSIFVTKRHSFQKTSEMCPITPEGRVEHVFVDQTLTHNPVKDITHFAFKLGNAVNNKLETRHDILFAVYMGINKSTLKDPISELDNKNNDNGLNIIDVILSHCGAESPTGLMNLFEIEFNQKLIFLLPNKTDDEFYGEICSRKTDPKKQWGKMMPGVDLIKKNITDNTLVINPNRFVIDEEVYTECVKEVLDFIEMKVDADEINKMISYRTFWYNKQPKYILDYNFKI